MRPTAIVVIGADHHEDDGGTYVKRYDVEVFQCTKCGRLKSVKVE